MRRPKRILSFSLAMRYYDEWCVIKPRLQSIWLPVFLNKHNKKPIELPINLDKAAWG
jgi:hypothetical protein